MKINKVVLVERLSNEFQITKTRAEEIFFALTDEIQKTLAKGGEVYIPALGKFFVKSYTLSNTRNPKTGEKLPTKKVKRVRFSASKHLKDIIK